MSRRSPWLRGSPALAFGVLRRPLSRLLDQNLTTAVKSAAPRYPRRGRLGAAFAGPESSTSSAVPTWRFAESGLVGSSRPVGPGCDLPDGEVEAVRMSDTGSESNSVRSRTRSLPRRLVRQASPPRAASAHPLLELRHEKSWTKPHPLGSSGARAIAPRPLRLCHRKVTIRRNSFDVRGA
jgi:hypothetical protein